MTNNSFRLSVILPIFNEAGSIPELVKRCRAALSVYEQYELIFVDDRSSDDSFQLLSQLAKEDPTHIKVIRFSRNFGHQIAITAGLDIASGDAVVIMDSDLQDPPELIPEMLVKWQEGYEVVYARRRSRRDTPFKKATAFLFYRILRKLANVDIPTDTGDFRLMDKKVVQALRGMREHSRFMRGLTSWTGFRQTHIFFDRDDRKHGETHYPLVKMVKFALDGITSFSHIPLRMATYVGFLSACVGLTGGLYAFYWRFFLPEETVPGWTTIVVSVFFIGGIQLIILGVIGEYIGRIYTELQARPLYIVDKKMNLDGDE
ncbi:MAG: glycosyltransferase family 2 protein [Candidatus Kerfeldbacteria bacterium]|nr:glycosyltransferase family 2 protein [Candidatus Kerfeldbacteria bacterium]